MAGPRASGFHPTPGHPAPASCALVRVHGRCLNPHRVFALFFDGRSAKPRLDVLRDASAPVWWPYLFRFTNLIIGMELLSLVLFMEDWSPFLRGSACWFYLGRKNSIASLVRGDSNTDVNAAIVARFWQMAQAYDICPWFSMVRSEINPSDLPTRSRRLPYPPRRSASFGNSIRLVARCRAQLSILPP